MLHLLCPSSVTPQSGEALPDAQGEGRPQDGNVCGVWLSSGPVHHAGVARVRVPQRRRQNARQPSLAAPLSQGPQWLLLLLHPELWRAVGVRPAGPDGTLQHC